MKHSIFYHNWLIPGIFAQYLDHEYDLHKVCIKLASGIDCWKQTRAECHEY